MFFAAGVNCRTRLKASGTFCFLCKEKKMKHPTLILKMFVVLMVLSAFAACSGGDSDTGGTGGGGGTSGVLTVNNAPQSGTVIISDSPTLATQAGIGSISMIAVGSSNDKSSYPLALIGLISGGKFTKTGKYLVVLTIGGNNYFQANVQFTNGSATVDFNSMTPAASLPLM
jgi:hypothetical protein